MFVATRWFLVLFLSFVGVFASLAEVNAGRFCRRASACPCVPVVCVPASVECMPVPVATHAPALVYAARIVTFSVPTAVPLIKGKATDATTAATTTYTGAFTVTVKAITATSGGVETSIATYYVTGSSGGTYAIPLSAYTDSPYNNGDYAVEFVRDGSARTARYSSFPWVVNVTRTIDPSLP
jgi:hypothetical protein